MEHTSMTAVRALCLGMLTPVLVVSLLLYTPTATAARTSLTHSVSVGDIYVLVAKGVAFSKVRNETVRTKVLVAAAFNVTEVSDDRAKLSIVKGCLKFNNTVYSIDGGRGVVRFVEGRVYLGFKGTASSDEGGLLFIFVGRVLRRGGRTLVLMVGRIRTEKLVYKALIVGLVRKHQAGTSLTPQTPSTPSTPRLLPRLQRIPS